MKFCTEHEIRIHCGENFDAQKGVGLSQTNIQRNTWRSEGWAELPHFLAVARTGSLRAAADELGINHATVNSNIKKLEAHYGVRLFDRLTTGLALTPAGENLLEKATEAEGVILSGKRRVGGLDRTLSGSVHLNISAWNMYYVVANKLPRFYELYPDIDLKITVSDDIENLSNSDFDVTWRVGWDIDANVTGRKVYSYHSAVLASEEYLARHWQARGPYGEGLQWIGKSALWPNPELERMNLFPAAKRVYDTKDPLLINDMLERGFGMAIVPLPTLQVLQGLTVVPGTPIVPDRTCWVLLQSDLRHTARVRALVDFLFETAKDFSKGEDEIIRKFGSKSR